MKQYFSNIGVFFGIVAIAFSLFVALPGKAGTSHNISGWAWSNTVGWISMNCTTGGANSSDICSAVDYGVTMDTTTGVMSGYAWSPNVGWVSFNGSDLSTGSGSSSGLESAFIPTAHAAVGNCSVATVINPGATTDRGVTGCAKVMNAGSGWNGLISLSGNGYSSPNAAGTGGVTLKANNGFTGYAWGDTVMGWIDFTGVSFGEMTVNFKINDGSIDHTTNFSTALNSSGEKSLTFSWTSTNATSCVSSTDTPTDSRNAIYWPQYQEQGVSNAGKQVIVGRVTTYGITCSNDAGTSVAREITVSLADAPTLNLQASPSSVAQTSGQTTTLTWSTTNAGTGGIPAFSSCSLKREWASSSDTKTVTCPTVGSNKTSVEPVSGSANGNPTKYTLTGTYDTNKTVAATVTVTAVPPTATLSLYVTRGPVTTPGTLDLGWTSTNTSSCSASNGWSGTKSTNGTQSNIFFTNPTTYTLTCSGTYGGSVTKNLRVSLPGPGQQPRYQEI